MTADNSKTLLIPELNESYHSTNGARAESQHIYIECGLSRFIHQTIELFEMGFGTGLNAALSCQYAVENDVTVNYTALEKYPVSKSELLELNYSDLLMNQRIADAYSEMHDGFFSTHMSLNPKFGFQKILGDLKEVALPRQKYDLVYFDAFAPKIQPELWSLAVFSKIAEAMKSGGVLVTYCSQGQFRRNLTSLGFNVEKLTGPTGKREITRAIKS